MNSRCEIPEMESFHIDNLVYFVVFFWIPFSAQANYILYITQFICTHLISSCPFEMLMFKLICCFNFVLSCFIYPCQKSCSFLCKYQKSVFLSCKQIYETEKSYYKVGDLIELEHEKTYYSLRDIRSRQISMRHTAYRRVFTLQQFSSVLQAACYRRNNKTNVRLFSISRKNSKIVRLL